MCRESKLLRKRNMHPHIQKHLGKMLGPWSVDVNRRGKIARAAEILILAEAVNEWINRHHLKCGLHNCVHEVIALWRKKVKAPVAREYLDKTNWWGMVGLSVQDKDRKSAWIAGNRKLLHACVPDGEKYKKHRQWLRDVFVEPPEGG